MEEARVLVVEATVFGETVPAPVPVSSDRVGRGTTRLNGSFT